MYSSFQLLRKYLGYRWTSYNGRGHGMHSPFVYAMIREVFMDKRVHPAYARPELYRKKLLHDDTLLQIEDFGAGSVSGQTKDRKVSDIAKTSVKPRRYSRLVYRIAAHFACRNILEMGTSLGVTSSYLAQVPGLEKFVTMEGAEAVADIAERELNQYGKVEVVRGEFLRREEAVSSEQVAVSRGEQRRVSSEQEAVSRDEQRQVSNEQVAVSRGEQRQVSSEQVAVSRGEQRQVSSEQVAVNRGEQRQVSSEQVAVSRMTNLDYALSLLPQVDLAFIDGNHRLIPTLQYFETILPKTHADSIIIFDDIHWSAEMEQAWDKIRNDERVKLSIDLFFIGIVFFKKEFRQKQHFTIRF